ncbi:hypothetical protein BU26DRAFT_67875 [Trematosphaeria pertusa]|uniref:Uncharacterized protein n=1 Tax=Trematosphaeria pertusa TaxID=390896 RepID=A0A6A6I4V4_9PLEO|nr:uncharacterized protein BU26DRAFT_67875 [Trematosphaeria pertusa]KAF2245381.1 hypothetical protein BU26DRAFT_67875 [Trematosphaeria pertusa]
MPAARQDEEGGEGDQHQPAKRKVRRRAPKDTCTPVTDFSFRNWTPPVLRGWNKKLTTYFVGDLAAGVPRANFPQGADKGPLTCAIEYVLDHPAWNWLELSDIEWFIPLKGFHRHALRLVPNGPNPDAQAHTRHENALKGYRERILRARSGAQ